MLVSLLASFALATVAMPQDAPAVCSDGYGERVCTTAALTALRIGMESKFAAVLALGNRPETWRARHEAVMRDLRTGQDYDGARLSEDALAQLFRDHIADLDNAIAQATTLRALPPTAGGKPCLSTWLDKGCDVTATGTLWSRSGPVYWQHMEGASDVDGVGAGIVLWIIGRDGIAKPVSWSFDGVYYEPPRLTQSGMIWVPGRFLGTGERNGDLLFRQDEVSGEWQDIDIESWRDSLAAKLPKGFGVWKGVDYDFEGLAATGKLWRDNDPNCCPSGGEVLLEFEIEGRKLILKDARPDIVEKWARKPKD